MQIPRVFDGDTGGGAQYVPGVILRASGSGGTVVAGTASAPLPVSLANTGANATAVKVDGSAAPQPVTDNGTSLTVDAPVGSPAFVRLSDGSAAITNLATNLAQVAGTTTSTGNGASGAGVQRFTLANDSTGVVGLNAGTNLIGQVGRKNTFDAASTLTTTTNFTSLANGSGWSGGSITTSGCYDIRFRVLTKGSSASNTLYLDFFLASAIAGETTFDDAASASADQAFTAASRKNSRQVGTIFMNGTGVAQGSFSALDTFQTLPAEIVPIAINGSGAALSGTAGDHVIKYECVR
jgi:hypothetical protein